MSKTFLLLFMGAVLGVGIAVLGHVSDVAAQGIASPVGTFQLMQHSNTTANVGVFRINSSTGEVSYCYVTGGGTPNSANLSCTPSVR